MLSRVLLAQQKPHQALALLETLYAQATAEGRTERVVEVRALQVLGLAAGGNQAAGLRALAETLAIAASEGYVRVFVDEGPMARLLGRLAASDHTGHGAIPAAVPRPYLDRMTWAFKPRGERRAPRTARKAAPGAGLVEPLSDRELQVLQLLASGKSNQQIAEDLVVSVDTVKKHVGHILTKLEAANRTQAVARARALGLLG